MENGADAAVSQHIQAFSCSRGQNRGLPAICLSLRPPLVQPHQDSSGDSKALQQWSVSELHALLQNSAGPEALSDAPDGLQTKNIKSF